jgi:hypothetical protein
LVRNMMRILFLTASALIGALASFAGVPLAGAQNGCAQLDGNVQSGNICRVHVEKPLYVIDVSYDTDYPDYQPVNDYISQYRDRVVSAAQKPGAAELPYYLTIGSDTFRSGQPTRTIPEYGKPFHGTISLVVHAYQSMASPGTTSYKSFTYDYDQNRTVTFENLFAPGSNPIDSIYPAVATEMARQQFARNFHLAPSVGRDPAHYRKFAITDDTVIFFVDSGEFLPQEAGYFFVPVSRANLPPLQV